MEGTEPATRGHSDHANLCRAAQRSHREKNPLHVCYLCAIPTIIEIRKVFYGEKDESNEEIILRELKAIAQNKPLAVQFTHKPNDKNHSPWSSKEDRQLIDQFIENTDGSRGYIVTFAPSRIHANKNVFFAMSMVSSAQGDPTTELPPPPVNPSLDECTELSRSQTQEGIDRLQRTMNPTPMKTPTPLRKRSSPRDTKSPAKKQEQEQEQDQPHLWLGFNMSVWPPRNIKPLKPSQMPNRAWAYIPFLWEIAAFPRHPSWTFDASELPEDWPNWVAQYKAHYESQDINIGQQLMPWQKSASVPFDTQLQLLQPLSCTG